VHKARPYAGASALVEQREFELVGGAEGPGVDTAGAALAASEQCNGSRFDGGTCYLAGLRADSLYHSVRNAAIGSTRAARRAGNTHASIATATSSSTPPPTVSGSVAERP